MTETGVKLSRKIGHRRVIHFGIENAERDVYELPYGKKYHLCIVNSKADIYEAIDLCHDLKSRFHLKCTIFSHACWVSLRDVQVKNMMSKSVGVVLLLSPAFFKDKNCVSDMVLAVEMSNDRHFSAGIINVLLQDIDDLPLLLIPYICIEAQKTCDIAAKISEAFCQIGSSFIDKLVHIVFVLSPPHTHTHAHTHFVMTFNTLLLIYLYAIHMTLVRKRAHDKNMTNCSPSINPNYQTFIIF